MSDENENINENILNTYIILLNTTFETYTKLKKWNKFPTISELKSPLILQEIHKKLMISLKILTTKSKSNREISRIYGGIFTNDYEKFPLGV